MAKILAGFLLLWLILDRSAAMLGSLRGEAGLLVCAIVLVAALAVERGLFGRRPAEAALALGLGLPKRRALLWSIALVLVLVAFFPVFAAATETPMGPRPGWPWLLPGLFAQGGIAEETVFRGFLFRHLRTGRSFWRAAALAAIPFVAVHLLLFMTLDFALALASIVVAVSLSFPFAWVFERAGNSIWPPAILHFIIQGAIKLVIVPEASFLSMAVIWMVLGALAPWTLLALRPGKDFDHARPGR